MRRVSLAKVPFILCPWLEGTLIFEKGEGKCFPYVNGPADLQPKTLSNNGLRASKLMLDLKRWVIFTRNITSLNWIFYPSLWYTYLLWFSEYCFFKTVYLLTLPQSFPQFLTGRTNCFLHFSSKTRTSAPFMPGWLLWVTCLHKIEDHEQLEGKDRIL